MAQKQKRKKSKKWLVGVVLFLLFVVAAVVCYLVWDAYFKTKDNNGGGNENTVVEDVEKPVENSGDTEEEPVVVEKEKVVQYEGDDPNELEELTGAITYAGVFDGNFMVRVNIDQYLSEGSCELELVKDGAVAYSDTTDIVAMVTTATCDGFNVAARELSGGQYDVVVNLASGGKTGVIRGEANV